MKLPRTIAPVTLAALLATLVAACGTSNPAPDAGTDAATVDSSSADVEARQDAAGPDAPSPCVGAGYTCQTDPSCSPGFVPTGSLPCNTMREVCCIPGVGPDAGGD